MRSGFHMVRTLLAALAIMTVVGAGVGLAQTGQDPRPAAGGQPSGSNPTAMSVKEDQLLGALRGGDNISGRNTFPDPKAAILQQPQGRDYRGFREGWLPWIGGIAVLGMLIALAVFYFSRGRIALEPSDESGVKIQRFNAFERFTHWMTATCFIVLALSGLNYIFGKRLLMPLIGPDAFAGLSQWAKYAHNFLSWPFMLGVLFMLVVWVKDNIPDRYDWAWLRAGGGFLRGGAHPDAARFNAGQKLIFWSVALGGIALSVTGIIMLFPFSYANINGMQWAQYIHAVVGVILIAIMIAHIYIGSLGMEGAYDAMGSGEVDLAGARRHHRIWVEEQQAKTASGRQPVGGSVAPAE
ncbi:MAG TPA: formate dehydrogenase subunit gamma [Beijerinckiaceae bacterium]